MLDASRCHAPSRGGRGTARAIRAAIALVAFLASGAAPPVAEAQPPGVRPVAAQGGGQDSGSAVRAAQREALERRFAERLNTILRERLALTDEQYARLRDVAGRVEDERRTLRREEWEVRGGLRREMLGGQAPDETRIGELLDRLTRLERRRVELLESEQRELAKFLSPSQRARYFALQDELRRNMQDMLQRRLGDPGRRPPGAPPMGQGQRRPPGS